MKTPAVETERISKRFGTFTAVEALDLRAFDGEVLVLLGPNGAGKTTLLKMILGLLRPTSGRVLVRGRDLSERRTGPRPAIGYMSQRYGLYPLLTGAENIAFAAGIAGLGRAEVRSRLAAIRARVPAGILDRRVRDLSSGFRQEIAFYAALTSDPEILILDEPASGAGPALRREFWTEIASLKSRGCAIIITSHELDDAENADTVMILDRGRVAVEGSPSDLTGRDGSRTMESVYLEALRHGSSI